MRAVKSVLVMAGQLKRENPDLSEDVTLIRALRDSNLPKFLYDDVPLFMAIIQDLFPGKEIPTVDYGRLQSAIERELQQASLTLTLTLTRALRLILTPTLRLHLTLTLTQQ